MPRLTASRPLKARIVAALAVLAVLIAGAVVPATAAHGAGASLSGVITTPTGPGSTTTIGGADVLLINASGGVVQTDTTLNDGVYAFTGLSAGTYTVRADMAVQAFGQVSFAWLGDGAFFESAEWVVLGADATVTGADLSLESGSSIFGVVRNASGSPLSGVPVSALLQHPDGSYEGVRTATTDASGTYRLFGLHSGDYTTFATPTGSPPTYATRFWHHAGSPIEATAFPVTAGSTESGIDLVLPLADGSDSLPTAPLLIQGLPQDEETVGVDLIGWDPSNVSFEMQWYLDGVPIIGAVSDTYDVQREDVGHDLTFGVVSTRPGYAPSAGMSPPVTIAPLWADVAIDHFFNTELEWMRIASLSNGYIENGYRSYHPGEDVSRQAMAAFLFRLAGSPDFTMPVAPTFADVSFAHPFSEAIEWMYSREITNGNPGPGNTLLYLPEDSVTRQAMAAFIYRFAGEPAFEAPMVPSFTDVPSSGLFHLEIEWLKSEGITTGYDDGGTFSYHPLENVTRQSMAVFLYRHTH